jgi:hypothetical protein
LVVDAAEGNSSYFYPSINSSLVVSDLFSGITSHDWITYFKLRGGIAQVGSDAAPYQLQTLYNGSSSKFGSQALYSLDNKSANPFLKPERTYGSEVGAEISFVRDRATLDATYYNKRTTDQIIPLTIAPHGFSFSRRQCRPDNEQGLGRCAVDQAHAADQLQVEYDVQLHAQSQQGGFACAGLKTIIIASQWGANIEARQGEPYGVLFGYGYLRDSATGQLLLSDGLPQRAAPSRYSAMSILTGSAVGSTSSVTRTSR